MSKSSFELTLYARSRRRTIVVLLTVEYRCGTSCGFKVYPLIPGQLDYGIEKETLLTKKANKQTVRSKLTLYYKLSYGYQQTEPIRSSLVKV